jgi:hypothetical protein
MCQWLLLPLQLSSSLLPLQLSLLPSPPSSPRLCQLLFQSSSARHPVPASSRPPQSSSSRPRLLFPSSSSRLLQLLFPLSSSRPRLLFPSSWTRRWLLLRLPMLSSHCLTLWPSPRCLSA